jgi:hypothetical protein
VFALSVVLKVVLLVVAVAVSLAGLLFLWRRRKASDRFPT